MSLYELKIRLGMRETPRYKPNKFTKYQIKLLNAYNETSKTLKVAKWYASLERCGLKEEPLEGYFINE